MTIRTVALVSLVALAFLLGPALSRAAPAVSDIPIKNGVDAQATLSGAGHAATVTGTVDYSQAGGRPVQLRVTLTETAAGVVSEGLWQRQCSDANQSWSLVLTAGGDRTLTPGPADVAVLDSTDAVQWIGTTMLVQGS